MSCAILFVQSTTKCRTASKKCSWATLGAWTPRACMVIVNVETRKKPRPISTPLLHLLRSLERKCVLWCVLRHKKSPATIEIAGFFLVGAGGFEPPRTHNGRVKRLIIQGILQLLLYFGVQLKPILKSKCVQKCVPCARQKYRLQRKYFLFPLDNNTHTYYNITVIRKER